MFRQSPRRASAFVALVAFVIQVLVLAPSANAKWTDRSGELEDDSGNTVLIVVGVIAVGVLVYVLATKGGGDEKPAGEDAESPMPLPRGSQSLTAASGQPGESLSPVTAEDSRRLGCYFSMENRTQEFGRCIPDAGLSNITLEVGLSLGF